MFDESLHVTPSISRTEGKLGSLVIQVTCVSFCSPKFGATLFLWSYGGFDANQASLRIAIVLEGGIRNHLKVP